MSDHPHYQAGVHGVSADAYHADPCVQPSLSAGLANHLDKRSPLHAWTNSRRLNPGYVERESDTFDLGSACHAMLLEGGAGVAWLEFDDYRTKDAKAARDHAREEGRIPVLAKHQRKMEIINALAAARLQKLVGSKAYQTEQSILWTESGTWCRARPDAINADRTLLVDYKTTSGSAEPDSWIRNHLTPEGHDIRAIHYLRGNQGTGGPENADYLFLVQEVEPPYACSVIGLAPSLKELAARKWVRALRLWRLCLAEGKWPGYPAQVCYAEAPNWEMQRADERDLIEGHEYDPAKLWEGIK